MATRYKQEVEWPRKRKMFGSIIETMEIECPISCVRSACPDPDFLEKHSTFLLTLVGVVGGGIGVALTYCLRSRCTRISLGCLRCDRQPLEVEEIQAIEAT